MMIIDPYRFGGGAGGTAYRYVRLLFPDGGGGTRLGLREIEMATTLGGADQAGDGGLGTAQAASFASSSDSGNYDKSYAFTNDVQTGLARGWVSTVGDNTNAFIGWDFNSFPGTPQAVAEVRAYSAWNAVAPSPNRIVVQGGDNLAGPWTELFDTGTIVFGGEEWKTINADGVFSSGTFTTSDANGTSPSGYASIGTLCVSNTDVEITSVTALQNGISGSETYQVVAALVNGSNVITSILATSPSQSFSTNGTRTYTFSSPVSLSAGQRFVMLIVRTDAGDTGFCHCSTPVTPGGSDARFTYAGWALLAKVTPAIGDGVGFGGSTVTTMTFAYTA